MGDVATSVKRVFQADALRFQCHLHLHRLPQEVVARGLNLCVLRTAAMQVRHVRPEAFAKTPRHHHLLHLPVLVHGPASSVLPTAAMQVRHVRPEAFAKTHRHLPIHPQYPAAQLVQLLVVACLEKDLVAILLQTIANNFDISKPSYGAAFFDQGKHSLMRSSNDILTNRCDKGMISNTSSLPISLCTFIK